MPLISLRQDVEWAEWLSKLEANFNQIYSALDSGEQALGTPYLGCVSNLGRYADWMPTDHTVSMSVTTRVAQSPISHPRVLHHNWYSNTTSPYETLPGAACTYQDWIEYPIGVATHGGATVTAPNGEYAVNDLGAMTGTIPAGAKFKVWTKRTGPQVLTAGRGSWHLGAGYLANPVGVDALPQLGHVFYPGQAYVNTYWPTILDMTTKRSVLLIDDSHGMGEGERGEPDLYGFYGFVERFFQDRAAWCNMSTRGMSLQHFISSHTQRVAIGQFFSEVFVGLGGNDVSAGRNEYQMLTDLYTILDYYPDKGYLTGTETPKTTSTDGWTTTTNQTIISQEGVSRAFSRLKMYSNRFDRVYDWCKGASFFRTNGQLVHKPNLSSDGNHFNADGYEAGARGERQNPVFY